jgi:2-oxo-3-hexenedioate decarboxylase
MSNGGEQLVRDLVEAKRSGSVLEGRQGRGLGVEEAYRLQDAWCEAVHRGEEPVGYKLGLTAPAKQRTMGISEPIVGLLYGSSLLQPGELLGWDRLVQPRVEPEVAVLVGEDVSAGDTLEEALGKVAGVAIALEVLDSRFSGYRFDLDEVIADNTSAGAWVLWPTFVAVPPDLALAPVTLWRDGEEVAWAAAGTVLGGPLLAVLVAARLLEARGRSLRAGSVLLTGGITDAVPIEPGGVVGAEIGGLGMLQVRREERG